MIQIIISAVTKHYYFIVQIHVIASTPEFENKKANECVHSVQCII